MRSPGSHTRTAVYKRQALLKRPADTAIDIDPAASRHCNWPRLSSLRETVMAEYPPFTMDPELARETREQLLRDGCALPRRHPLARL